MVGIIDSGEYNVLICLPPKHWNFKKISSYQIYTTEDNPNFKFLTIGISAMGY